VSQYKLFDGDDALFREVVSTAQVYAEYGVGLSTGHVYTNTSARIVSVESSVEWANRIAKGKDSSRIKIYAIDLGPLGEWGTPLTYAKRANFPAYVGAIWQAGAKPDVVLIDGRFRVASFLASVLHSAPGTRILFDDYIDRPHYHLVEEFVPRRETCGRQALFERPAAVDDQALKRVITQFQMVWA
jgi:hypothetical protein